VLIRATSGIEPTAPEIRAIYITVKGGTMHAPTRSHAGVAATGIAVVGIAAMAATPLVPPPPAQPPPAVSHDIRLAVDEVPPGGLVTSFLNNQVIYCSIICPTLIRTGVTAAVTTLATPVTFVTALQSGDLLKAIGVTAASVTGPTNAAATASIVADGTLVAPRALNAFEVGVVGLLNVVPAAAGGLPGVVSAIQDARQDTFTALNAPIVPNPTPTVMPRGVFQVAVVGAINVVAAVIFPALNLVLNAAFQVPDAVAQELAASGDPVRAATAGVTTAARSLTAAVGVVADSVVTAANDIRTAAEQSQRGNETTQVQKLSNASTSARPKSESPRRPATTTKHASAKPGSAHTSRNVASTVRDVARTVKKNGSERPHRVNSRKADDEP
jgi:hypothetical protein